MIYFLVNNNYHMHDVSLHMDELRDMDKSLIQIPHSLKPVNRDSRFVDVYTFHSPFKRRYGILNPRLVKRVHRAIETILPVLSEDVLFLYTEYEVLNQKIIKLFKERGAKVFLIEDGGFPTYITYNVAASDKLSTKECMRLFLYKHVHGYKNTKFIKFNNVIFPQISDSFIDGVCLYYDVPVWRNIKRILVQKKMRQNRGVDQNSILFLNENIYDHYCDFSTYLFELKKLISGLSDNFKRVYFKYHPREQAGKREAIRRNLEGISNISIIQENDPIEEIIDKYHPTFIASYLSAALLNLHFEGYRSLYMFTLCESLKGQPLFRLMHELLTSMGYRFPQSPGEIRADSEFGFSRKNMHGSIQLKELLL